MTRRAPRRPRQAHRGAGRNDKPAPGWQAMHGALANPRPPAVPATLHLTLEDYFAAAALIGLLASQGNEPDQEWVRDWSYRMGRKMARLPRLKR